MKNIFYILFFYFHDFFLILQRLHSVWQLRKCKEEDLDLPQDVIGTPMMRHSMSYRNVTEQQKLTPLFNTSRFSNSNLASAQTSQPTTPGSQSFSSFEVKSGKPTPNTTTSNQNSAHSSALAKITRTPSLNQADFQSRFLSMVSFSGTPDATRNPEEPLPPDISLCLDHLWTEPIMKKSRESAASKVFLARNIIGQSFMCFLVKNSLVVVQIHQDGTSTLGAAKTILDVQDATPCPELGMTIILDQRHRKLSLYSGSTKVCGVHFSYSPSVQLAHIAQEIATLHIDSNNDQNNDVVTSSRPSSAIDPKFFHDSSMALLSPVALGSSMRDQASAVSRKNDICFTVFYK